MSGREPRMHQLTKGGLFSWPKLNGFRGHCFERLDQQVKGPLRILESVNQDGSPAREAAQEKFRTVGHGTIVAAIRRKDLLDGRRLVFAVVPSNTGALDLYGPVRELSYREITLTAPRRVTTLPGVKVGVPMY